MPRRLPAPARLERVVSSDAESGVTGARIPSDPVEVGRPVPWAVYLLECAGGRSYVGISPRPAQRYAAHVAGRGGAFTRANPPLRCVRVVWFDERAAAAHLEVRLKSVDRSRKWQWFAGFPDTTAQEPATRVAGLARLEKNRALSST